MESFAVSTCGSELAGGTKIGRNLEKWPLGRGGAIGPSQANGLFVPVHHWLTTEAGPKTLHINKFVLRGRFKESELFSE